MVLVHHAYMGKKTNEPRHFLRAWRIKKDYTLERAADAIGITHATLSRIERGLIAYTQPVLEALADLYGQSPATLIMRDPDEPDGMWSIWDQIPPQRRQQAFEILETFAKRVHSGK